MNRQIKQQMSQTGWKRWFLWMGLFSVMVALSSCQLFMAKPAKVPERVMYEWHDDGGAGKVSIRVSLKDQIAEFERGGRPIGWSYVATGKIGHSTQAGEYRITEKEIEKTSNRYGWIEDAMGNVVDGDAKAGDRVPKGMIYVPAPMPYWMRITSYGVGLHGGVIPEPGKPASHGCIRLPKEFVPTLYEAVDLGAKVSVTHQSVRRLPLEVERHQAMLAESVDLKPAVKKR